MALPVAHKGVVNPKFLILWGLPAKWKTETHPENKTRKTTGKAKDMTYTRQ